MAKALKIEIQMAGNEEIARQFEAMSKAGKDCFQSIVAEAKKVGSFNQLDPGTITKKMEEFGVKGADAVKQVTDAVKTAGKFETLIQGIDLVEAALMRAGIAGKGLLLVLGPLGAVIAIVAIALGVALVSSAIKSAQAISELERTAIKLGTSFENLTKLKAGFEALGIPFESVVKGLQQLQGVIDKFNLDRVNRAFAQAKANMASGWGAGAEQLRILQEAAKGVGPAADAARQALASLGQPFDDRVTPAIEGMVRSAGSATKAIPLLANELARLGSSGEKTRFMEEILKRIAAEAGGAANAIGPLARALDAMGASAERDKAILSLLGDEMGTRVVQAMRQGGVSFADAMEKARGLSQATADSARNIDLSINKIKAGFAAAFENIPANKLSEVLDGAATKVQGFAQTLNAISWEGFSTKATTAMAVVNPPLQTLQTNVQTIQTSLAQDIWTAFVTGATTALGQVNAVVQQLVTLVQGTFTSMWQNAASQAASAIGQITTALDGLIQKINEAIQSLNNLQAAKNAAGGGSSGGLAGGGLMGGRGTGTSDSNLAWLSRGEYVTPARAVRQPGVLQLLEALRRSGGNLRSVLDRMGHFALGGMVSAPAFAAGGAVGGMSNVTIQFPGVQPVTGLRASSAVVDELRRSAALAQVRSGGRKPSRYT